MTGEHATHEDHHPVRIDSETATPAQDSRPGSDVTEKPGLATGVQPALPDMSEQSAQADFVASGQAPPAAQRALKRRADDPGANSFAGSLAFLLDTDLFFAVKVTDTLKHAGYTTKTLRRPEDFAAALVNEQPTLALVNTGARGLDWRSGIAAAVAAGVPVVAFGSHVDLATQQEARELGATSVIANSKLASDLPGVVARALKRTSPRQE